MQPPILPIILLKLERFYREAVASSVAGVVHEACSRELEMVPGQPGLPANGDAHVRDWILNERKRPQRTRGVPDPGADRLLLFSGIAPVAAVPTSAAHVLVRLLRGGEDPDIDANYEIGQQALVSQLPDNFYARKRAYLLLQRHGEVICKHDQPGCEDCPVNLNCVYFTTTQSRQNQGE